jgi:hypothetical protein
MKDFDDIKMHSTTIKIKKWTLSVAFWRLVAPHFFNPLILNTTTFTEKLFFTWNVCHCSLQLCLKHFSYFAIVNILGVPFEIRVEAQVNIHIKYPLFLFSILTRLGT